MFENDCFGNDCIDCCIVCYVGFQLGVDLKVRIEWVIVYVGNLIEMS